MNTDIDNERNTLVRLRNIYSTEPARTVPDRYSYDQTRNVETFTSTLEENRIVSAVKPGDFTNSYKILRSQILQKMKANGWNTLGVTSPGHSEGKTLTATNLAISLALEVNHSVLLVDADMRTPGVAANFGIKTEYGLADYLTSDVPMEDLLIHPYRIDRFIMMPGGGPIPNSSEILSSQMMLDFIANVKLRYPSRIVVFDLPPILVAGESLNIAPHIDSILLVIEAGKTKKEDIVRSKELLAQSNLLGTVLSKS